MSLIRKHVAVLQAWACLDLVNYTCVLVFIRSFYCISLLYRLSYGLLSEINVD